MGSLILVASTSLRWVSLFSQSFKAPSGCPEARDIDLHGTQKPEGTLFPSQQPLIPMPAPSPLRPFHEPGAPPIILCQNFHGYPQTQHGIQGDDPQAPCLLAVVGQLWEAFCSGRS